MNLDRDKEFLLRAVELSRKGMEGGAGGPFGCVITKDNEIVGEGYNQVTTANDPTAHAEIVAIRNACAALGTFQLTGCTVYTSCEPCPMCLGAIYWARPLRVIYSNTREDAASIEFDDEFIYNEIASEMEHRKIPFIHFPTNEAAHVFKEWQQIEKKIRY